MLLFIVGGRVADSRTQIGTDPVNPDETTDTTEDLVENVQESVIPSTGGRAVSPDKFAVVIGPLVFDSTVTMSIEQNEVSEEEDGSAITPRYTVTYTPEDVQPYADSTVRVELTLKLSS